MSSTNFTASSTRASSNNPATGVKCVKWVDIENDPDLAQYLHAPLPPSDASRFRIGASRQRMEMLEKAARQKGSLFEEDLRQVYVPTIALPKQRVLPSMSDLMVMETRFYLVPRDEDTPVYAEPASYRRKLLQKQEEAEEETDTDNKEEGGVLDLGTIVLQKIITQMRGLRGKSRKTDNFNSNASRVAGLNKYCDYLKGNGVDGRKLAELQENLS